MPSVPFSPGQTLLFDADDTLWENNIYFERAIAGFVELLAHPTLSSAGVRDHFNRMEHTRVQVHGYGTRSFRLSMTACLESLAARAAHAHEHARLDELAHSIVSAPIDLLPDVKRTLQDLATRHRLLLVTKGDPEEQLEKLERSGLSPLFDAAEVVYEKNRGMYEELCLRHGCSPRPRGCWGTARRVTSTRHWRRACTRSFCRTAIRGCWSTRTCWHRRLASTFCRQIGLRICRRCSSDAMRRPAGVGRWYSCLGWLTRL